MPTAGAVSSFSTVAVALRGDSRTVIKSPDINTGLLGASAAAPFADAARRAEQAGLGVNAGHDLNLTNLSDFASAVNPLAEVSIGHALISDALYLGLAQAVKQYKACLAPQP